MKAEQVPQEWIEVVLGAHRAGSEAINEFDAELILAAVLPKVRERIEALQGQPSMSGAQRVITVQEALNAFDYAFPEEESCERCESGRIATGECLEAMSGPTCGNPSCPPCRTPETDPCPDCQPGEKQ
jgi:hypothetical protein